MRFEKGEKAVDRQETHDKDSDQALVARVAAQDRQALAILYERHSPAVLGLALKVLDDRALAEDVVQDVFWRLWRQADRYDAAQASFRTWFLRIARNMAIDVWRRKVRTVNAPELVEARLTSDADLIAQRVSLSERAALVHEALSQLPPDQRHVIEESFFAGKTRRQIAADSDTPVGTIHTRARLALQKLHLLLSAEGLEASHE